MQPRNISNRAFRSTTDILTDTVLSSENWPYESIILTVQNGNVQGNRKSPNPFSFQKSWQRTDPTASFKSAFTSGDPNWRRYDGPYGTVCPSSIVLEGAGVNTAGLQSAAYAQALNRLTDQVRAGSVDASVDLIQFKQTLRLKNLVQDLTHQFSPVLMRNFSPSRKIKSLIKGVSDFRLAWVYGILPTMNTVYDVATYQSNYYRNNGWTFTGRGSATHSSNVAGLNWPWYYGWAGGPQHWNTQGYVHVSSRSEIKIRMKVPDNALTQAARLSSLNPVSILWEAMPYSFVADYFVNIGDYLRDLETSAVYSQYFDGGYRTDTTLYTFNQLSVGIDNFPIDGSYSALNVEKTKNRTILTGYPVPDLPRWQPQLGSARLYNLAALFGSKLRI